MRTNPFVKNSGCLNGIVQGKRNAYRRLFKPVGLNWIATPLFHNGSQ
ncbi:MAG: hypothetical protein IKX14_08580 [Neisseriaceae bacterium]|nr:hypothetical protein [Neisseriaceae bacterium]